MIKRQMAMWLLVLVPVVVISCSSTHGTEDEALNGVVAEFQQLKSHGKILGLRPDESGELSASRVTANQRREKWFQPFAIPLEACSTLYLVEVTLKDERIRLFFCGDSQSPRLAAAYKWENGMWHEEEMAE